METEKKGKRAILHVDMDAFFAAIEQRDCPEYRGRPVIVGGSKENRGVVSTASYEARAYGVHSALPMAEAERRCPHGIYLPVNMKKYHAVSREIMVIFQKFTPDVEAISVDEAFLDVTASQSLFGTPKEIAQEIKKEISQKLYLTASVGVSYNKFLAKLASDLEKPNGLCVLTSEDVRSRVWSLPVERMMGVGEKTAQTLRQLGVNNIGMLAHMDSGLLNHLFGKQGIQMQMLANGVDDREVIPIRKSKSVGREITFPKDIQERYMLETVAFTLVDEVCYTLRHHELCGKTVSIKVRYPDFHSIVRSMTLNHYTSAFEPVYHTVKKLIQEYYMNGTAVRLLGVAMSNLKQKTEVFEQQTLFGEDMQEKKYQQLNEVLDQINDKYGGDTVKRARKEAAWGRNKELL